MTERAVIDASCASTTSASSSCKVLNPACIDKVKALFLVELLEELLVDDERLMLTYTCRGVQSVCSVAKPKRVSCKQKGRNEGKTLAEACRVFAT